MKSNDFLDFKIIQVTKTKRNKNPQLIMIDKNNESEAITLGTCNKIAVFVASPKLSPMNKSLGFKLLNLYNLIANDWNTPSLLVIKGKTEIKKINNIEPDINTISFCFIFNNIMMR